MTVTPKAGGYESRRPRSVYDRPQDVVRRQSSVPELPEGSRWLTGKESVSGAQTASGNVTWPELAQEPENLLGKTTENDELAEKLRVRRTGRGNWVESLKNIGVVTVSASPKDLAGRQGVFTMAFRNPMNAGLFRVNLATTTIWRFRILSPAFVYSLPFSGSASAMTLEMSLAAKDS
jgi:hypothetical protein